MNYCSQILLILSLLFFTIPSAFAYVPQRGNVNLTLSPYYLKSQLKTSDFFNSVQNNGVALTAIGDVSPRGSLEISSIFYTKEFYRADGAQTLHERSKVVHVTMGYRYWIDRTFSTSFSFFTGYPLGSVVTLERQTTEIDFKTSARENSTAGLDLAFQAELWSQGRWALQAETRYSHYFEKLKGEDPHQLGIGIGLRYFLQSRVKKPMEYKELNNQNNKSF